MARLVVGVVFVQVGVDKPHVERHLAGVVRCDQHLGLFFGLRELVASEYRGVARLRELHQLLDELLLLRRGRDIMQYLVFLRPVHAYVLRRAVVRDLVVELRQLRHFDKVAEALFLHDVVRYRKLEVRRFLGEDGRPCVEAADVLFLQRLRAQVLEQQI